MASPLGTPFPRINISNGHPAFLPLIGTTASLSIAIFEVITFNGLLKVSKHDHHSAARTISLWWKSTIPEGLIFILSLGLTSLVGGIRAIRGLRQGSLERYVAIAGTVFAAGHFAFAWKIANTIRGMAEAYERAGEWQAEAKQLEEAQSEVVDERVVGIQREWLRVHTWRTLTVDLPAWLCFGWLALRR